MIPLDHVRASTVYSAVIVALVVAVGCGATAKHRPHSAAAASSRAASRLDHSLGPVRSGFSQVVWVAQDASCSEDEEIPQRAIELDVHAMWGPVMQRFGADPRARVFGIKPPDGAEAIECGTSDAGGLQALKNCLADADPTRGVTLIFVGHGASIAKRGVAVVSQVCLGGKLERIEDVLAAIPKQVPWRFAIVVACYSATVDVRGEHPTSVLSSSPGLVGFDTRTIAGKQQAASAIATAIAEAMGDVVDANCDGVISDHELHERVLVHLKNLVTQDTRDGSLVDRTTFPRPRLRRNATATLPLFAVPSSEACAAAQRRVDRIAAASAQRPELVAGLAAQRRLLDRQRSNVLPASTADFFVLANEAAQRDCVAGRGRFWHAPNDASYAAVCRAAIDQGLEPLSLPERSTREDVRAVGRYVSFADVYWIALERGWVHVDRMRDDRRVATRSIERAALAMPSRRQLIARSGSGDETLRYTRQVAGSKSDQVTVCPQDEGQCFVVRASATSAPARPEVGQ